MRAEQLSASLTAKPGGNADEDRLAARSWWCVASDVAEEAQRRSPEASAASYRFGDATLDVDSSYRPLLDELASVYGDCASLDGARVPRVRCSARLIEERSLVALRFSAPVVPDLFDAALSLVRPRLDLQHFSPEDLSIPGWRLLGNKLDPAAPLLATGRDRVLVDIRHEPPEFLLDYVVGVAQLTQPSIAFVHGGGVSIGGAGTLLIGRSGGGKSTTSAVLASRGHSLLGDETVGIRFDSGEMLPFRSTLKLRPGPHPRALVEHLRAAPRGSRPDARGLDCAWIRPSLLFPDVPPVAQAPLKSVFFLRGFGDQPTLEPFVPSLERHLPDLQQLTMSMSAVASWTTSPARRLMRFVRLIELFSARACYFLDLGTPEDTAALIERTVTERWH